MSAVNPDEALKAKWIYISFLQFTWIGMTAFGVLLRTVYSEDSLQNPEAGLVEFFQGFGSDILLGFVLAGVLAAIASTIDSILVAVTSLFSTGGKSNKAYGLTTIAFGLATIVVALSVTANVFDLAVNAITWTASIFAAPVLVKLMRWNSTDVSITCTILAGVATCVLWNVSWMNVTPVALLIGLITNWLTVRVHKMQ